MIQSPYKSFGEVAPSHQEALPEQQAEALLGGFRDRGLWTQRSRICCGRVSDNSGNNVRPPLPGGIMVPVSGSARRPHRPN